MSDTTSLTALLRRHREGDPDAARDLFAYYSQRLSLLAEQHLSQKLSTRVEGDDVVQSVFRTFFRRTAQGEFRIDNSDQLWQLLVKITILKARGQARRHTAGMRDVGAEQSVGDEDWIQAAVTRDPGPEDAVILVDQIEVLLRGLPPMYSEVLEKRLEGCSVAEIAGNLAVARQTVYRALDLLQVRLTKCL